MPSFLPLTPWCPYPTPQILKQTSYPLSFCLSLYFLYNTQSPFCAVHKFMDHSLEYSRTCSHSYKKLGSRKFGKDKNVTKLYGLKMFKVNLKKEKKIDSHCLATINGQ